MGIELSLPLPRMTYQYAMENYGSDKPDTRYEMKLVDVSDLAKGSGFPVFETAVAEGGRVRGINAKGAADMTRKQIDALVDYVKPTARGARLRSFLEDGAAARRSNSSLTTPEFTAALRGEGRRAGGSYLLVADRTPSCC
jgi:aspartyl-tRNA synthetase